MMSEFARLSKVMLCSPVAPFTYTSANDLHYQQANSSLIASEILALANLYRDLGVEVAWFRPTVEEVNSLNDYFFCRDQLLRLPNGVMALPMGVSERRGEWNLVKQFLSHSSDVIQIESLFNEEDSIEGADVLWAGTRDVVIGIGKRTSHSSASKLASYLERIQVSTHFIPIDFKACQHLLGILQFISPHKALVRKHYVSRELRELLLKLNIEPILIDEGPSVSECQGMNIVMIDQKNLVMPAGLPNLKSFYESLGLACFEANISECVKAAGGIACLTGILRRS